MLLDLSSVTQVLIDLLVQGIRSSPAWASVNAPVVVPLPPDRLTVDSLGLYLYHLSEDPHRKNLPAPGRDTPPIAFTPMGLNLYYQLCANSSQPTAASVYNAQLLMSCAVKTLHDYPILTDTTQVGVNLPLFQPYNIDRANNVFRLCLQPVPFEEAVSYWTAGAASLRLAAYYQVSVVILEPEQAQSRTGRVLRYGVQTFAGGTPHLDGSLNVIAYQVPGDPTSRSIEVRPAQVPVSGTVTFLGSGLAGDRVVLRLRHATWAAPVELDLAWGVASVAQGVIATVQEIADVNDVVPGIYSASIGVAATRVMPDGSLRDIWRYSNDSPFVITPRIDNVSAPTAAGLVTIDGYLFQHAEIPAGNVEVYLDDVRLDERPAGPLLPNEFSVNSPTQLRIQLPPLVPAGSLIAVRILVNGAESPPNWIQT